MRTTRRENHLYYYYVAVPRAKAVEGASSVFGDFDAAAKDVSDAWDAVSCVVEEKLAARAERARTLAVF